MTKFCKTAKRTLKNVAQTGGASGVGTVSQILDNNGITLPIDSSFSLLADKDWVKNNKGFKAGKFVGDVLGLVQAVTE